MYSSATQNGMTLKDMQASVQQEAMDRYIMALEREAKESSSDLTLHRTTIQAGLDDEAEESRRRKEQAREHQLLLRQQMEANKVRRADHRREYIEAASTHSFPLFTETFISLTEVEEYRRKQKEQFRAELDAQKATITTMRNLADRKDHDLANSKISGNLSGMHQARKDERENMLTKRREMVNNWDRDIRLKTIKKAILGGKDVVRDTLGGGSVRDTLTGLPGPRH